MRQLPPASWPLTARLLHMLKMSTGRLSILRLMWSHGFPALRAKKTQFLVCWPMKPCRVEKMIQSVGEVYVNQALRFTHGPNDTMPSRRIPRYPLYSRDLDGFQIRTLPKSLLDQHPSSPRRG
jgi:hypothetical protein